MIEEDIERAIEAQQRDTQKIHPFNIIGLKDQPQTMYDGFICPSCKLPNFVTRRRHVQLPAGEVIVCKGCMEKSEAELSHLVDYCAHYTYHDLYEQVKNIKPLPGMGATLCVGSDNYAYTIVAVKSPCVIEVTQDSVSMTGGSIFSDQEYAFGFNPDAKHITVRKNHIGQWKRQYKTSDQPWIIGYRLQRRDPHI